MTRSLARLAVALLCVASTSAARADVRNVTFRPASLGRNVSYMIDLPESYGAGERRYPVLYVLHGLFESPAFWQGRGLAPVFHDAVGRKDFPEAIVIAVDGGNSFFINGPLGRFEDLVVSDLVAHVDATYRTIARRNGRVLLGVSMGGYGALRIAFEKPEVFGAVATHSAMLLQQIPTPEAGARGGQMRAFHAAFGEPIDAGLWHAADPLELATRIDPAKAPALYFDCGSSDRFGLFAGNAELHRRLEGRRVAHEFTLHPGDHGYEYVRSVLPLSLRFLARHLESR